MTEPYAWFAEPLHLYLTITNLSGVPYTVKGASDSSAYHMVTHSDRLHFKVSGLGTDPSVASDWPGLDKGTWLTIADLQNCPELPAGWTLLGDGALATAAFPGGLAARVLRATQHDYKDRWFPAPNFPGADIQPAWPNGIPVAPNPFGYVNADGGVTNNDPFDYARYCLLEHWRSADALNPPSPADADRAVVMIAPFPEGATIEVPANLDTALVRVLTALLPALIQQARFKIDELAAAADPTYASRWLIAPRRTKNPNETPSSANIACGLMGGFGGFLDQRFREHDFLLGRRNCQQFLRQWKESSFTQGREAVIPLLGSARQEVPDPEWPSMSQDAFHTLLDHIGLRADAAVAALLKQDVLSGVWRWVSGSAWWCFKGKALSSIRGIILGDLIGRGQIEDGLANNDPVSLHNLPVATRAVIAALADQQYDLRTVQGICASAKLSEADLEGAITTAAAFPAAALYKAWQSPLTGPHGEGTYTLWFRQLPPYRTWWMIGPASRRLHPLRIN